ILQDSRGYLWIGTGGGGVCRFDGLNFMIFNKKRGLSGNTVRSILEDSKGNLWFATDEGITLYDGYRFLIIDSEKGLPCEIIVHLFEDAGGNIWAGTSDCGLCKINIIDKNNVAIENYTTEHGLSSNKIFHIAEDSRHRLWLGTFGRGIDIVEFTKEGLEVENRMKIDIPSNMILTIMPDAKGNMWIGSYDGGAFSINNSSGPDSGKVEFTKLNNRTIWDIYPSPDGQILFASDEDGLVKLDGEEYEYFDESSGMPTNQILCVTEDSENNIWAGTMGSGMCMFRGKELIHYTEQEGLPKDQVMDIIQDKEGFYWLATYGGGLFKCDFKQENVVIKNYTTDDGLVSNVIMSLAVDKENNIWIGTDNDGVCMFNGKEFINHITVHEGLLNNTVNAICIDNEGIIWFGTIGGISMYDGMGLINYDTEQGLVHNEVQTIIEDKQGVMWYGTLGGLMSAYGGTGEIFDEESGLYDKKVYALTEDKNGDIWIGTFGGGIYKLDRDSKDSLQVKFIADDKLLSSNNIYSLIFESDQALLAGTNRGFDRIILDGNMQIAGVKTYDLSNGFIGVETKPNAIHRDGLGDIWFGTVRGVTRFSSRYSKKELKPPQTHITNLKLSFEDVDWEAKSGNRTPWFTLPKDLTLKYNENHLTFDFSGISLSNPEKVYYKFMMEGLDKEWSPPRKESEIT
ncbi:MAG: hypothetical protein KJ607_11715, partial [Bacteroidetes bacterium]|nr:hypothetical protein [Bacteroidota bacterium]